MKGLAEVRALAEYLADSAIESVRRSDTVQLLTTNAATSLTDRAKERQGMLSKVEQDLDEVRGLDPERYDRLRHHMQAGAERSRREVDFQLELAALVTAIGKGGASDGA